jgi:hypothetical protein
VSRSSAYARAAKLQAQVRFGGQQRGLTGLLQDAADRYAMAIRVAKGSAAALQQSAKDAKPQVSAAYNLADRTRAQAYAHAADVLGAAGPGANAFRSGMAVDQANVASLSGAERASALRDLHTRGVQANEAALFATTNAAQQFASDAKKIGSEQQGLAADKGAFTSATIDSLRQAARDAHFKQANLDLQTRKTLGDLTGVDPVTGKPTYKSQNDAKNRNARKKKAAGPKPLTADATQKFTQQIGQARGWIDRLVGIYGPSKHSTIRHLVTAGGRVQTQAAVRDKKTNKVLQPAVFETVPGFGDPDIVNAAYDLHSLGGLSRPNIVRLSGKGYHVPRQWKAPRRPTSRVPTGTPRSGR